MLSVTMENISLFVYVKRLFIRVLLSSTPHHL